MIDNEWNFEQVYTSFQPKIYRYLTRLVGASEAEDLTQEVFMKVSKAQENFRKESKLFTWIYRIATNAAIDRMRNPSWQRELIKEQESFLITEDNIEFVDKGEGLSTNKFLLEEQVIHKETNECIRGVIERLPEDYRIIVILSELGGLKNKEIAEILELNINVVKVRLHRGKTRLKKELLNHCNFSWDERNEFTCDPKIPLKNDLC